MAPATKRRKTQETPSDSEEDDELFLEPEEVNQNRDPLFCLERKRAHASYKLKSRYEDIFAKYGKDFTGIGDEIDLVSGKVVVDNGHLKTMTSATDTGWGEEGEEDSEVDDDHQDQVDDLPTASNSAKVPGNVLRTPSAAIGGSSRLPGLLSGQHSFIAPDRSFSPFTYGSFRSSDPAWQTPDVPESAFLRNSFGSSGRRGHQGAYSATRKISRKIWAGAQDVDADDEDVLAENTVAAITGTRPQSKAKEIPPKEVSAKAPTAKEKESPVIKHKFPTFSSPQDDPTQRDLVNDLIENMPPTPPSIRNAGTARYSLRGRPSNLKHTQTLDPDTAATEILEKPGDVSAMWDESDLVTFVDITGKPPLKPLGQVLYVHIEENLPAAATITNVSDERKRVEIGTSVSNHSKAVDHKSTRGLAADPLKVTPKKRPPERPREQNKKAKTKTKKNKKKMETFSRNVIDPAFDFSDEDTLLPRRLENEARPSEALPRNYQETAPNTEETSIHNIRNQEPDVPVPTDDHLYQSDTPLRSLPRGSSTPAASPNEETQQFDSTGDFSAVSAVNQQEHEAPLVIPGPFEEFGLNESPQAVPTKDTAFFKPLPRRSKRKNLDIDALNPQIQRSESISSNERQTRGLQHSRKRESSPELGDLPLVAEVGITEAAVEGPEPVNQPRTPLPEPSTPQTESKENGETSFSFFSLLSADEDDEDEISFDHSDFTPSGHHRIILEKPFMNLKAPSSSIHQSVSTKKMRASLSSNKKSTSASFHHGKFQTPRGASSSPMIRGSTGDRRHSTNKKHHKSRYSRLAHSIVRVVPHRGDGDVAHSSLGRSPTPSGNVVQTPGGTRRRCGKDGFRCDQDFCFVCS